ncbi:hypothetical protein EG327_011646 [Venturia inaequalis]|uniref:Uncharacterized protein n=1 Tax=Venturia inaequalis TaxID=5025 RepID=A0A8H3UAQ0_VENIN|nr:hypothetical protein EG327_011646 [Venturia inaequalis]
MDDAPTVESEARNADRYSEIIQQLIITQQNQSALLEQQAAQLTDAANGLKKADTAYNAVKSDNDSLKAFMKDFFIRIQSSYRTRAALKPALSASFYWDAINNCLTLEKRARMRGFWAAGGTRQKRDPEEFLSEIERVFADSMEKTTALEKLVGMKHADGQPWQDHLVVFDELLLASDGGQ